VTSMDPAPPSGNQMLGPRVQQYRHLRGLSLRELAEQADVSASFISQLENGRSSASIATLARIAAALEISLGDLFDGGSIGPAPMSPVERPVLLAEDGVRKTLLTRGNLDGLAVYGAEFAPGGSTGPEQYSHPGNHEVVVVVRGRLGVELNTARHELSAGDSIAFDSALPHRLVNTSDEDVEAHWIVGPPQRGPVGRRRRKA